MPTFWVAYAINNGTSGMVGTGACDVTTDRPPATLNDIAQLADLLTDELRKRRALGPDHWVTVQAWSRMGE